MESFEIAGGSNVSCTSKAQVELERTTKNTLGLKRPSTKTCGDFEEDSNPRIKLRSWQGKQSAEMMDSETTVVDVRLSENELCLNSEARIATLEKENADLRSKIEDLSKLNDELFRSKANNVKKAAALMDENLELKEKYSELALAFIQLYDHAKKTDNLFSKVCNAVDKLGTP